MEFGKVNLTGFINNGSDDELLKSLPADNVSEEMIKAMNRMGLVQKEVTVQGKNGKTFTRKQWVKASEDVSQHKQSDEKGSARQDYYKAGNFYTVGKSGNFAKDMQFLSDRPSGVTVKIKHADKTETYAMKTGKDKWTTDSGKTLSNNDIVSAAYHDYAKVSVNYMIHTQPKSTDDSKSDSNPPKSNKPATVNNRPITATMKKDGSENFIELSSGGKYKVVEAKALGNRTVSEERYITVDVGGQKYTLYHGKGEGYAVKGSAQEVLDERKKPEDSQNKNVKSDKPNTDNKTTTGSITIDDFEQTSKGVWESKNKAIDAAVLKRDDKGRSVDALSSTAPAYRIVQDGEKFRVYKQVLGRKVWLKNEKSLDNAVKVVDKFVKESAGQSSVKTDSKNNKNTNSNNDSSKGGNLSKEDAKKKTQSFTSKVGKSEAERSAFMDKVKAQGITWKENDKPAINWMRCCMAMNDHFANGGEFKDSGTDSGNVSTPDPKKVYSVTINGEERLIREVYKNTSSKGYTFIMANAGKNGMVHRLSEKEWATAKEVKSNDTNPTQKSPKLITGKSGRPYSVWKEGSKIKGSVPGKEDSKNARDITDFTNQGFDTLEEVEKYVKKYF